MDEFDAIVGGMSGDAITGESMLLEALEDEWRHDQGDRDASPSEVMSWVVGQLHEFFGPGVFGLFMEANYRQATWIQPSLEDIPAAPVSSALRAALESIDFHSLKLRRQTEAVRRLLEQDDDE